MWISKKEQKIYDLGWLVGFWVGEGHLVISRKKCITKADNYTLAFGISQNEISVLEKAGEILNSFGINNWKISKKDKNRKNILYLLYVNQESCFDLVKLFFSVPVYSKKRDLQLEKALKIVLLKEKSILGEFID